MGEEEFKQIFKDFDNFGCHSRCELCHLPIHICDALADKLEIIRLQFQLDEELGR